MMSLIKPFSKAADKLDTFRKMDAQMSPSLQAAHSEVLGPDSLDHSEINPDTQKVLAAIHACQSSLTTRIVDISLLRQDAQLPCERVTEVQKPLLGGSGYASDAISRGGGTHH